MQNNGFEAASLNKNGDFDELTPAGWTRETTSGFVGSYRFEAFAGSNVVYITDSSISQKLSVRLGDEFQYTLSVAVKGARNNVVKTYKVRTLVPCKLGLIAIR